MLYTKTTLSPSRGFFVLIFGLSFSLNLNAQTSTSKQQHYELSNALDGVFQIQMINLRNHPSYDTDLLIQISNEQKQNERVTFLYKPNIRILILSKNEAQNGITFSQDEKVIYINQ